MVFVVDSKKNRYLMGYYRLEIVTDTAPKFEDRFTVFGPCSVRKNFRGEERSSFLVSLYLKTEDIDHIEQIK